MRNILTIYEQDITPDAPSIDPVNFFKRTAVRAVVFDESGRVALLNVARFNYHKLPGGGVEDGEDLMTALDRELLEEIGCRAEVTGDVGMIVECRDQFEMVQTSYCFKAKLIGDKGEPNFTDEEADSRFSIVWADDIDEAIMLLEKSQPSNYDGKFIKARDLALLQKAKELSDNEI